MNRLINLIINESANKLNNEKSLKRFEGVNIRTRRTETFDSLFKSFLSMTNVIKVKSQEGLLDSIKNKLVATNNPYESVSACDVFQLDYYEIKYFNN